MQLLHVSTELLGCQERIGTLEREGEGEIAKSEEKERVIDGLKAKVRGLCVYMCECACMWGGL